MRARASKKSILAFITITLSVKMMNLQNPHFYSPHHQKLSPQNLPLQNFSLLVPLQPTCRFLTNNVSFSLKQRIVFSQTTCCFLINNVLFSRSRAVINDKSPFCNFLVKKIRRGLLGLLLCSITNVESTSKCKITIFFCRTLLG